MTVNSVIYNAMLQNNNVMTTGDLTQIGVSRTMLSRYVKAGLMQRVRQGTYTLSSEIHDDMYTMMLRSPHIIFSHETALFLNGLSDRTPFIQSLTIPSNASLPKSINGECNCFYVNELLYPLGVTECKTAFGNQVRCYNPERTICDIVRSRTRLDEETFVMAIRNYAKSPTKNLNLLTEYATKFRILKQITQIFEIIL